MDKTPKQVAIDAWNECGNQFDMTMEHVAAAVIAHVTPAIRAVAFADAKAACTVPDGDGTYTYWPCINAIDAISNLPSSHVCVPTSLLTEMQEKLVAERQRADNYKRLLDDLFSDVDCHAACDSHGHHPDCPVTNAWATMTALKKRADAAELLANYSYAQEPAPQQMPVTSPAEQRLDSEARSLSAADSGPTQHAASLAAVARHKGETPETDNAVVTINVSTFVGATEIKMVNIEFCKLMEQSRNSARAKLKRLRSACQEMNHALSRCAYLSGEPNEQECSWYDVQPYPQAAIEAVQKMRDDLLRLRAQIAESHPDTPTPPQP